MECKNDMLDTLPYNANWLVCNSYEHTQVHCFSMVVKHFFPESTKTKDFPLFSFGGSAIAHTHHHSTESLLQDRCVVSQGKCGQRRRVGDTDSDYNSL